MLTPALWLAILGPVALAGVGMAGGPTPASTNRRAMAAGLLMLTLAAAAGAKVALYGTLRTPTIGADGIGFSLYLDRLSAVMLGLVSFIGVIVLNYSRHYLDGDPKRIYFTRCLCLTLASVLLLIMAGNLLQFALAWIATSVSLHRLLVFYPERPAAILAARKKYLASRLSDICLLTALVLIYRTYGSLDYTAIFGAAESMRAYELTPAAMHIAACLLVCTGALKSAQFPLHGWLIEVMETPTPVSALLHAGVVNAGGFLVIRFSDLVALSVPSLDFLAVIGGFTALFGSVVMLTQTSIKVSLAYSTIAQMGFMMLECGLGAFSAAMLHIVAHSLYKAHAFLSSGSVIDIARASWTPSPGGKPHPARLLIAIAAVLGVTFVASTLLGATLTEKPGLFALGAVLLLGLIHLVANGIDERPNAYVIIRIAVLACIVATAYFGLQFAAEWRLASLLPSTHPARGPLGVAIVTAVVMSFAAVTFFQSLVPRHARDPKWQAVYAHIANGFYVNTIANRLVLRFWPNPPETRLAPIVAVVTGAAG